MDMKQEPSMSLVTRLYLFLRERDARIIEMFFLGLNLYILAFVLIPPHSRTGFALALRIAFQLTATIINLVAVIYDRKSIRMTSAISNTVVMALISTGLILNSNPHAGTYTLITLLAAFVCWRINVR